MNQLSPAEKRRATIIQRYGSIEAYIKKRYNDPSRAEQRRRVASLGGKSVPAEKRNFSNSAKAQEALKKRWPKIEE